MERKFKEFKGIFDPNEDDAIIKQDNIKLLVCIDLTSVCSFNQTSKGTTVVDITGGTRLEIVCSYDIFYKLIQEHHTIIR